MKLVTQADIDLYLAQDLIAQRLDAAGEEYEALVCQCWLRDTVAKRYIYEQLYGDLFTASAPQRVLDVGGGLTGLTPLLAKQHDYTLVELLAHDSEALAAKMMRTVGKPFIRVEDWYKIEVEPQDLVIANDLFPNADQRLELFLAHVLPHTKRVRLSLTYYDTPRFYSARRMDADEILCMLAWNSRQLRLSLEAFAERIVDADMACIVSPNDSLYDNGRQICLIELRGDRDA